MDGVGHLQSGVSVEFIEKVHEQVYFECADTQNYMFLRLSSVAAVVPSRLLSLHPQVDQLLKLASIKQISKKHSQQAEGFKTCLPGEEAPQEQHRS